MATEKRLIDALNAERPSCPETQYDVGYNNGLTMAVAIVGKLDAVEAVRCEDYEKCHPRTAHKGETGYACDYHAEDVEPDGFCYHGIRRSNENKT